MVSKTKKQCTLSGRRVLPLLFAVCALLAVCLVVVAIVEENDSTTETQFDLNGFTYRVISEKNREVEVSGYYEDHSYIDVPSKVTFGEKMYVVTSIGKEAFSYSEIITVILPDSVVSIGDHAFSSCSELVSVKLPLGLMSMGDYSFSYCHDLESIVIPDGLKNLGHGAFFKCAGLKELTIPISIDAVNEHRYLVPSYKGGVYGYDEFVTQVFKGCESLGTITFTPGTSKWYDHGNYHKYTPWCANDSRIKTLIISEGVPAPRAGTFDGFKNLTKLKMPVDFDSVVDAKSPLFKDSVKIEEIVFTNGSGAWCDYSDIYMYTPWQLSKSKIVSLSLPDGISYLPAGGFKGLVNLSFLGVPLSVDLVGDPESPAFEGCTKIKNLYITQGSRGAYEYESYVGTPWQLSKESLEYVHFSISIKSIGAEMFKGCTSLGGATLPSALEKIGKGAFQDCTSFAFVEIPPSVKRVGERAFQGCSKLSLVNISNGVNFIGPHAFADCSLLPSISIPDSVEYIGDMAFSGCISLETVTFGKGLTYMGGAFEGFIFFDEKLVELAIEPENVCGFTFKGIHNLLVRQAPTN